MSKLSDVLFGKDAKVKSVSTLSKEQQRILDKVLGFGEKVLDRPRELAQSFPGALSAPIDPSFERIFSEFSNQQRFGEVSNQAIEDLISGRPAFEFDPGATQKAFTEQFANPIMEIFRQVVLPGLRETQNLPGNVFSRGIDEFTNRTTTDFFAQQIAPRAFDAFSQAQQNAFFSGEQAKALQTEALSLPFQGFTQQFGASQAIQGIRNIPFQEQFFKFQQEDPFAVFSSLQGVATAPTFDTIGFQGTQGALAAAAGSAAGAFVGAKFGSK